jgi:prophage antirepressor-like protein
MQKNEKNSTTPNELLTFAVAGKEVRVVIVENRDIWLVASDVAEALACQNAGAVLGVLSDAHIRIYQRIFDERGKPIDVTLVDVMGSEFLSRSVEPTIASSDFRTWVREVLKKSTIQELRAKAIQVAKPTTKQEIGFQTFVFNDNHVRTFIDENGNVWFAGVDICNILAYTNSRKAINDHCKKDGVTKRYTIDNLKRHQEILFINEFNLYRLMVKSEKPEAEVFEKWVFEEVLPTIRKTGKYELPTVGKDNSTNLPTEAEINPALLDLIMQKFSEIGAMRQDIDELKASFQKFLSPTPAKASYVYLAYNHNTGLYKPGKGDNPDERAFVLELGGVEIEIVSKIWFPSSAIALAWEKAFHKMFENEARGREWFALNERQVQFFKNVAELVSILYA